MAPWYVKQYGTWHAAMAARARDGPLLAPAWYICPGRFPAPRPGAPPPASAWVEGLVTVSEEDGRSVASSEEGSADEDERDMDAGREWTDEEVRAHDRYMRMQP